MTDKARAKIVTGEVDDGEFHSELQLTPEVLAVLATTMRRPPTVKWANYWYVVGRGKTMRQATAAAERWIHKRLPNTIVIFSEIT